MSDSVVFNEEPEVSSRAASAASKDSFFTRLVYKTGLAKTQKGADYVLIVVAVVCFALAIGTLFAGGIVGTPKPPPQAPQLGTPPPGRLP